MRRLVTHLEDFEVVLRFFNQVSDCKVHSLSVTKSRETREVALLSAAGSTQAGCRSLDDKHTAFLPYTKPQHNRPFELHTVNAVVSMVRGASAVISP